MSYKDHNLGGGAGGFNSVQQKQIRSSRTFELSGIVVTNDLVTFDENSAAQAVCELRFDPVAPLEEPESVMIAVGS